MKQLTLVALYGEKQADLKDLIQYYQEVLQKELGSDFSPYDIEQVHATIIGLERRAGFPLLNYNFWKYRSLPSEMEFDNFLAFLRTSDLFPFKVQIGGFQDRPYPFVSDPFEKGGEVYPYDRSFSVQGDKAVLMGWPIQGVPLPIVPLTTIEKMEESKIYPMPLEEIRKTAQNFGMLHAYHRTPTAIDNDLFFRIGMVHSQDVKPSTVAAIRKELSKSHLLIEIGVEDLFIAAYTDNKLPTEDTQLWSIADPNVDTNLLHEL